MTARRFHSGLAGEEIAARYYRDQGAEILAKRHRTPEGEIDLIVKQGTMLVFVEVKQRRRAGPDSPISPRQWRRLGQAAISYMMQTASETGETPLCRFDAALVGPDGSLEVIENARGFDEH